MKKTKIQKGITLIALIITIIVLLILAITTIGSMRDSDIITYAQNAASEYNKGKVNETTSIQTMENKISQYLSFNPISEKWAELNLEKLGIPTYINYDKEYSSNDITLWPGFEKTATDAMIIMNKDGGFSYSIGEFFNGSNISHEFAAEFLKSGEGYGAPNFISFMVGSDENVFYYIAFNFKKDNEAEVYYAVDTLIRSTTQEGVTFAGTISVGE